MKMKTYYMYFIFMLLLLLIVLWVVYIHFFNKTKEGFIWSNKSIRDFLTFQNTVNPNTQFNMEMIQTQASEDELSALLCDGYWPWSEKTQTLYINEVSHNPIVKMSPQASMNYARTVYNENATKQMLSWNTKEGQFLLSGVSIYKKDGTKTGNVKCEMDEHGKTFMKKTTYQGDNLWNGYKNTKTTNLKNNELPKEIPGFHFIKGPCNPCVALDNDYSCPFELDTKDTGTVSEVWKSLWSI